MSNYYSFATAAQLIFGNGCIDKLGKEAAELGDKLLLVTGQNFLEKTGILDQIKKSLDEAGMKYTLYDQIKPEPDLKLVSGALSLIQEEEGDLVIGVGGGSVLDVAKAAAGLANSPYTVYDHFGGREIDTRGIPFIAVPTTAGTGAEVTPNSVLSDEEKWIKHSIRSPYFLADKVLVDPGLMISLPTRVTAYSGMDALVQGIEAYTSNKANFLTDTLSLEGVKMLGNNIKRAYGHGDDLQAREAMAYGSTIVGMAFSNCRLGAVHGMAHPVGITYKAPHGMVCGILLPTVMRFNLPVASDKYARIAEVLGVIDQKQDITDRQAAEELIEHIENLLDELDIPDSLTAIGLQEEDISELARASLPSGSLKANPRQVTYDDLVEMFTDHLD